MVILEAVFCGDVGLGCPEACSEYSFNPNLHIIILMNGGVTAGLFYNSALVLSR